MDELKFPIAEFTCKSPDYSFLVNAIILHCPSTKRYLIKCYSRIIRYMQYKLFKQFTPSITPTDIDNLLKKIVEVYGKEFIEIINDGPKSIIIFISPEPITFELDADKRIEHIMRAYNNLLDVLEITLPITRSKQNPEKDLFMMHLSKYNIIHTDAIKTLFPASTLEIMDCRVVAHIIQLIHCISVGEWCMYHIPGKGHYATNTDTSKLLTFDRSIIEELQRSML
jgi:hypothetical protein